MRNGKLIRAVIGYVLLSALVVTAVFLVANRDKITSDVIRNAINAVLSGGVPHAEELNFSADFTNSFALYEDGIAVLSSSGIELIDNSNIVRMSHAINMSKPVMKVSGENLIAYDVGMQNILCISGYTLKQSLTYPAEIISADINSSGWYVVLADESGSKATAAVFDSDGKEIYKWYSSERYITSAAIADDNTRMVLGGLGSTGASISATVMLMRFDEEMPYATYDCGDTVILDMRWISSDTIAVLTEDSILMLDGSGNLRGRYDFSGSYLNEYSFESSEMIALRVADSNIGENSVLVTLDTEGELLGSLAVSDVLDISCGGEFVGVLTNDSIVVYNNILKEQSTTDAEEGSKKILIADGGNGYVLTSSAAYYFIG